MQQLLEVPAGRRHAQLVRACRNERLYMGRMCTESEVLLQPGHKWNNILFHNHTGLKMYPNYMMGGGYILSGDVSKMLLDINAKLRLKFTPIEDATLGFWLMSMDLRHVDHPKYAPLFPNHALHHAPFMLLSVVSHAIRWEAIVLG